jgi:hypothetical protein
MDCKEIGYDGVVALDLRQDNQNAHFPDNNINVASTCVKLLMSHLKCK